MRKFGLIGKHLKHSYSADFFNKKFEEKGLDARYELFEITHIDKFPELLLQHPDLEGLNITLPFKENIVYFLDSKDERVYETGACNTLKISMGKLAGFNTDIDGFAHTLQASMKSKPNRALILGSGGASKAVAYVLKQHAIPYFVVGRNPKRDFLHYGKLNKELVGGSHLIINTSPQGMYPEVDTYPDLPYEFLTKDHLLIDLVYNPKETRFMQLGAQQGARVVNGLDMLHAQAETAWEIWNSDKQ